MAYRYYRYTIAETLSLQDAPRALGDTGGRIVRMDNREGRTEVTIATSDNRKLAVKSPLGAGVEVSEDDVLNIEG